MTPKEWAKWYRERNPEATVRQLEIALRAAAKYGLWHKPHYAELVIKELKKL